MQKYFENLFQLFYCQLFYNASFTEEKLLKILKVGYPRSCTLDVIPDIQYNACKKVKHDWKTNSQKGRINKKQPDFSYGNMETLAEVSAHAKRMSFKKG